MRKKERAKEQRLEITRKSRRAEQKKKGKSRESKEEKERAHTTKEPSIHTRDLEMFYYLRGPPSRSDFRSAHEGFSPK